MTAVQWNGKITSSTYKHIPVTLKEH